MLKSLKNILKPTAPELVRVQLIRDVMVGGVAYKSGDALEVTARTVGELAACGAIHDTATESAETARRREMESLLPPPTKPEPAPEIYQNLPECFAKHHALEQAGRCLEIRRDAIEEKLADSRLRRTPGGDRRLEGISQIPAHQLAAAMAGAVVGAAGVTEFLEAERFLADALIRANEAFDFWQNQNENELLRLRMQCSDVYLEKVGEVARTTREIHAVGREIFNCRIAALCLTEWKSAEIFRGSSDFIRFVQAHDIPEPMNLRMAWFLDDGKDQHAFSDCPPRTLAGLLFGLQARGGEAAKALRDAKAELKKAQSVAAQAA